ncbi:MAG: TauD/TfdA family dioxygenase [Rhodospirillaceae bacterium]
MEVSDKQPELGSWIWSSHEISQDDRWIWRLSEATVDEIRSAVRAIAREGTPFESVTKQDFPLPSLKDVFLSIRHELSRGLGFCLIKGIPVDEYNEDELSLIHWGIGTHIGLGVSQSYRGDKIGHVMDMTHTGDTRRPYRSPGALILHVDPVDVVALFCLKKAQSGGESMIASSMAIYNTILKERPDLIEPLKEGFHYFHAEHQGTGGNPISDHKVPVFGKCEGRIECMYVSFSINRAIREKKVLVTDKQLEALNFLNEVSNRPEITYEMDLEKGDIQYLNNRLLLHGRRDYIDFAKIEEKRRMLRLWLKMEDWPRLPKNMYSRRSYDEDGGVPIDKP